MNGFSWRYFSAGLLFSILWASASAAGKIGLQSVEGLVLFAVRFFLAGTLMLAYSYFIQKDRLPHRDEWRSLIIFGLLNTAIYLGVFIVALDQVTAGITTISLAISPLLISVMTALWLKRVVPLIEWISVFIGITGVVLAALPLLRDSHASLAGLIMLGICMIAYSAGSIYYTTVSWQLSRTAVNAWQVLIGGAMLLPVAFVMHDAPNVFDGRFWFSVLWLVIPVSIGAVQLWLYLLKVDSVRASLWLFLCPIFGLTYASIILGEKFYLHTGLGAVLVLIALTIGQWRKK